jgi:hypothetical protein
MRRIGSGVVSVVIIHFRYMTSLRPSLIELCVGSDIIYMNVLGQSIIVIDKYETAVELLEKRSGIYSSRFVSVTPRSFYESVKANV